MSNSGRLSAAGLPAGFVHAEADERVAGDMVQFTTTQQAYSQKDHQA